MSRIIRTEEQVQEVLDRAEKAQEANSTHYPGLTYEDGITDMHRWLTDSEVTDPPIEDDATLQADGGTTDDEDQD